MTSYISFTPNSYYNGCAMNYRPNAAVKEQSRSFANSALPKEMNSFSVDWRYALLKLAGINNTSAKENIFKLKSLAPNTRKTARDNKISQEKIHLSTPVTDRTKYNTVQLKKAGITDQEVYKYLKSDGRVTDDGKKILREKGLSYK